MKEINTGIVGIGVSVVDLAMSLERFPKEESVHRASRRRISIGGGVTVAMATAAMLHQIRRGHGVDQEDDNPSIAPVWVADRLGTDPFSMGLIEQLTQCSVRSDLIQQAETTTPSVASVWINESTGSRTIAFSPGDDPDLKFTPPLAETIRSAKVLHCNGRHLSACEEAVRVAKNSGTLISFDGGAHRYRTETLPIVHASDVLIVSQQFAEAHHERVTTSQASPNPDFTVKDWVAFLLNEFDCQIAGVTAGERGSWVALRGKEIFHQPAIKFGPVIDTTGCGDTYHGGFLHALAMGEDLPTCARVAAVVAGANARSLGALAWDRSLVDQELRWLRG